jgi:hypothetical protein
MGSPTLQRDVPPLKPPPAYFPLDLRRFGAGSEVAKTKPSPEGVTGGRLD